MKKLVIVPVMLFLSACSSIRTPTAFVPVPVKRAPVSIPAKPYLPIYDLKVDSPPELVFKSYVASVKALMLYDDGLREACSHS